MKFNSIEELLKYTENIKGKTFREIDTKNLLAHSGKNYKGLLGHIVESGFYDYPINNDARADFDNIGVELKVTGYIKNKNGTIRAKERLVLSKINYFNVVNEEYNYSNLLFKNKKLLIIWYLYDYNKDMGDFVITDFQLYDMSKDEDIFKNDFEIIKDKLKRGLAHELSEGDTSHLGTSSKSTTTADRTKQPYSDILAKPKASSLKNAYMTGILRDLAAEKPVPSEKISQKTLDEIDETLNVKTHKTVKGNEEIFKKDLRIIKDKLKKELAHELSEGDTSHLGTSSKSTTTADRTKQPYSDILAKPKASSLKNAYMTGILRDLAAEKPVPSEKIIQKTLDEIDETLNVKTYKTVKEYIYSKLDPYFGMNQLEILEKITGKTYREKIPKNLNKIITDKLIGKDNELPEKDDLFRKTSFIIKNLPITPKRTARERMSFRTLNLSEFNEDWDYSDWKMYFEQTTLITILWKEPRSNSKNGERILDRVLKISFDEEDMESFEKTYNLVKKTIEKQNIKYLPVPGVFENQYLVIAPKGVKGDDAYNNFFKQDKTKVSFMLTKDFLNKKIEKALTDF